MSSSHPRNSDKIFFLPAAQTPLITIVPRLKLLSQALFVDGLVAAALGSLGLWVVEHLSLGGGLYSIPPRGLSPEQKIDFVGKAFIGFLNLGQIGLIFLSVGSLLWLLSKRGDLNLLRKPQNSSK